MGGSEEEVSQEDITGNEDRVEKGDCDRRSMRGKISIHSSIFMDEMVMIDESVFLCAV
jgi:hypothetical protein